MAMVSMEMTAEERKEQGYDDKEEGEKYPYGLRISLDDGTLEKLGLTQPPKVGAEFTLTAKVKCTSTRSYQDEEGEPESSAELQITAMEFSAPESSQDAASALYGQKVA